MRGEAELKAWARRNNLSPRQALRRLLDLAEGRDILGLMLILKSRYEQGMSALELAQLDVLYSWLGYVFGYRAPGEWTR